MFFKRKIVIFGLIISLTAATLTGCGSGMNGKKTVTTVNGETLSLGTLAYYAKYEQASMTVMFSSMMAQLGGQLFNTVTDEESGRTVGSGMVTDGLDMLEKYMVVSQHAADYGVELTDEDKAAIDAVGEAYIKENDKAVRDKIGASKEDVVRLLTLMTINSRMLEPMAADVDTEVSDEEAVQTKLTVVTVNVTDDLDAEAAKKEAQSVLDAALSGDSADGGDILASAHDIAENANVTTPNFTAADPSDSVVNQAVMNAIAGLGDNEIYENVIEADDGSAYYVVRVDALNDEEMTKIKRQDIITERKNANRDEMIQKWLDESEIVRDEKVLAELTVTDEEPFTMAYDEEE